MGSNVFANMMEFACIASDGKSVAAMPDVCWTPPQAPPTPNGVPIPYPNTGMASDLTDGSTTVTIGGKPLCLKDKSSFKKTTGDEAGSAPMKGMISMKNTGAVYFVAWSMNVKVEGENVVRNADLGTHNCGSVPANTGPWPFLASMGTPAADQPATECSKEKEQKDTACTGNANKTERCADNACRAAMKCELQPYKKGKDRGCCGGQTPHHIVEVHGFTAPGGREGGARLPGFASYDDKVAPCVCCDQSSRYTGDHGSMHAIQGMAERACMAPDGPRSQVGGANGKWSYQASKKAGLTAMSETFKSSNCSHACIEAQLDAYHEQVGAKNNTPLRADRSPLTDEQKAFGERVLDKTAEAAETFF